MPSYPMAPAPTFEEFLGKVEDHGCSLLTLEVKSNGDSDLLRYIERAMPTGTLRCPIEMRDDERLTPSQIRHLCRRLCIDPSEFGLDLG